jgi:1-deoxy-D-xylulose-5-phosphate reductoisomerase
MQRVTVLGATGSIGESTLDVIAQHPDKYAVFALTGNRRLDKLAAQCARHRAQYAVVNDETSAKTLQALIHQSKGSTEVLHGEDALVEVAASSDVEIVMAAIVGAAGLLPTLSAIKADKKVLLANKESLVMAGAIFMQALNQSNATLLPIDSEHNAIFQCLPRDYPEHAKSSVSKLILSASGGPFKDWSLEEMQNATPKQACAHPNWSMGDKISVDSASMMNKGLEVIEAKWLFDTPVEKIEVVVHPQSIIHSLVQYLDGSLLAQLGNPDMKIPIAYGLAWPQRIASNVPELDLIEIANLNFEAPDTNRFPCLKLAYAAAAQGGDAPTALNAANEIAVQAFLEGKIRFTQIGQVVDNTLSHFNFSEPVSLEAVQESDFRARLLSNDFIRHL